MKFSSFILQLIKANVILKILWHFKIRTNSNSQSMLWTLVYDYGKFRLPPVHKRLSLRSTAHCVAAGRCAAYTHGAAVY